VFPLVLKGEASPADELGVIDLDQLLKRVVELGGSDIHLKLGQPPVVRRDGELGVLDGWPPLGPQDLTGIVERLTQHLPSKLDEFRRTGELDMAFTHPELPRFRVNGFRQRGAISFAFRVIPKEVPSFEALSLPLGVQQLSTYHRGLILVTGATGAGKSTTLAAMVDHINRTRRQHILTIEDPIEILHADRGCIVNQREVGLDTASFGQALRRALRQDPDVILIGELRDPETAETALQAAESGHLVLSTMHTIDAAETVSRMIEFFPTGKQQQIRSILAGVLRGVVSQRLLPRIGGGRVAAVEVMVANARIADLIRENKAEEIPDAIGDGSFFNMQTFTEALIQLVLDRKVDKEIAANAAGNRHDFGVALERALKSQSHEEGQAADAAAAAAGGLTASSYVSPDVPGQAPPDMPPMEGGVLRIAGPSS
jgi:twitching motility protein PilT